MESLNEIYKHIEDRGFEPMPSPYKEGEKFGWRKGSYRFFPMLIGGKEAVDFVGLNVYKTNSAVDSNQSMQFYLQEKEDVDTLIRILKA